MRERPGVEIDVNGVDLPIPNVVPLGDRRLAHGGHHVIERCHIIAIDQNPALLDRFEAAVRLARALPFEVDLWKAQNVCYQLARQVLAGTGCEERDERLRRWVKICELLGVRCEASSEDLPLKPLPVAA